MPRRKEPPKRRNLSHPPADDVDAVRSVVRDVAQRHNLFPLIDTRRPRELLAKQSEEALCEWEAAERRRRDELLNQLVEAVIFALSGVRVDETDRGS